MSNEAATTSKALSSQRIRLLTSTAIAFLLSGTGYYIAEAILFGTKTAFLMSLSGSLIQSGGSAIVFIILGIFLDKMGFKKRFLK